MYLRYYSQTTPRVAVVADFRPGEESPVAIARCSDRDQFNRKLGRTIAEGRLARGRTYCTKKFDSPRDFVRFAEGLAGAVCQQGEAVVTRGANRGQNASVAVIRGTLVAGSGATLVRDGRPVGVKIATMRTSKGFELQIDFGHSCEVTTDLILREGDRLYQTEIKSEL